MLKYLKLMTVACACLAMFGCMAMQPLNIDPTQLRGEIKHGDRVEVVTGSGQQLQFAVDSVDDRGIQGGGQRVAFSDIRSISRNQVAVGKTTLLVVGILAAGAAAAAGGGGGGGSGY